MDAPYSSNLEWAKPAYAIQEGELVAITLLRPVAVVERTTQAS
jgi:hypothetical protein